MKPISYLNAFKITPNVNKADGLIKLLATDFHEKNLEKLLRLVMEKMMCKC